MPTKSKRELRKQLLDARRNLAPEVHAYEATALSRHLSALVREAETVCAYVPVGTEPGSVAMLDALDASGAVVLLPLTDVVDGSAQPLSWARYRPGELVSARYGLLEPTGPALPPSTISSANLVFIPALAVDRRGTRLGRGAGFYDRSLPLRHCDALLVAVVRDDELLDELPAEPHDVAMTHALTPLAGLVTL